MRAVREQWTGWLQVAAGALLFSVFPLWFLGTTMWVTIDRQLNDQVGEQGDPTLIGEPLQTATWVDWLDAGIMVAKWMVLTLPVFFTLFVVAALVRVTVNWRQRNQRAALDAAVAADAVIVDELWGASTSDPNSDPRDPTSDDGIHSDS